MKHVFMFFLQLDWDPRCGGIYSCLVLYIVCLVLVFGKNFEITMWENVVSDFERTLRDL